MTAIARVAVAVATASATLSVIAGVHASTPRASLTWQLPHSLYPSHTQLGHEKPTNINVQAITGGFHRSAYADLGRIDGQGWVQLGGLVNYRWIWKHHVRRRQKNIEFWLYTVSLYPSTVAADTAVADIAAPLSPLHGFPVAGGQRTIAAGGQYGGIAVLHRGAAVIEQACYVNARVRGRYGHQLISWCVRQRHALAARLVALAPTSTATPVPTSVPTSASLATPIPIDTATATTTAVPITDTPTATSTAAPPATATDTPTATSLPTPTATALPQPTATSSQNIQVTASVSNPTPSDNSTETIYGQITANGVGVSGVQMTAYFHYKTTTSACLGTSDSTGTASCSRDISRATPGYTVNVTVDFSYDGQDYTAQTSFTPS